MTTIVGPWPSELPQSPLLQGLGFNRIPNTVSFETEVGDTIDRRRFTGKRTVVSISLPQCTQFQKDLFDEFYDETTKGGSLLFTWKDFETGISGAVYKFVDPHPTVAPSTPDPAGGSNWRINFTMRRIY